MFNVLNSALLGSWLELALVVTMVAAGMAKANTLPTSPTNLVATITTNGVSLSWHSATDAETPSDQLTYKVRVGSAPGASDIVGPGFGDAGHSTNFFIRLAPPQIGPVAPHYYW